MLGDRSPVTPGERLRAIRRNSDEGYDEQLRNWHAVRKEIKASCDEAKKKRPKGSNHLSKYEQKNLESSLGVYWEL
jgi:hypothetical protein